MSVATLPPYPQWNLDLAQEIFSAFVESRHVNYKLYEVNTNVSHHLEISSHMTPEEKWHRIARMISLYSSTTIGDDGRFGVEFIFSQLPKVMPLQSIEAAAILADWQAKYGNKVGV